MLTVNRYLDNKNVKLDLKVRIRKYLDYVYESNQRNQMDGSLLLSRLSSSLKNDLINSINGKIIKNCPLFKNIFEPESLQQFLY